MQLRTIPLILFNKAISVLPARWNNRLVCSLNNLWTGYFQKAEPAIDEQWNEIIWPKIKDFDFTTTLDLAPGAGRNTKKLSSLAKTIYAVDYNEYALDLCRQNAGDERNGCKIYYHKNDGSSLSMIQDNSVTTIYCWDSAVHFDKTILRDYIREFARILAPGKFGFVHHSNLGALAKSDIRKKPGWRSNMTRELFHQYCMENRLEVVSQDEIKWGAIVDCLSIFRKK